MMHLQRPKVSTTRESIKTSPVLGAVEVKQRLVLHTRQHVDVALVDVMLILARRKHLRNDIKIVERSLPHFTEAPPADSMRQLEVIERERRRRGRIERLGRFELQLLLRAEIQTQGEVRYDDDEANRADQRQRDDDGSLSVAGVCDDRH